MHKARDRPHHMARKWAYMVALFCASSCPSLTSSSPFIVFPEKMMWQIFWIRLTTGRSLKVKTCKNKEICFAVLKPNERGLFGKPSEPMANKSRSSQNYQITKNMT
jgi:hypothetical protein